MSDDNGAIQGDPVLQLFTDFLHWWSLTGYVKEKRTLHPMRAPKLSDERRQTLTSLIGWCRERSLDSRQWLYFLFAVRSWIYPPKLESGYLQSERLLPKYKRWSDFSLFRTYLRDQHEQKRVRKLKLEMARDLSPAAEDAKRAYRAMGSMGLCLSRFDETLGFHPRSLWCAICELSAACSAQLRAGSGDVLALREGRVSVGEAVRGEGHAD